MGEASSTGPAAGPIIGADTASSAVARIELGVRPDALRHAMSHFASGVTVVTALVDGVAHAMTATAFSSVSLDPPLGLVCVDEVVSATDLAILAAGPERYAEYAADVRREHGHVPDEAFRSGRSAVLRDLLAKPHLFHTEQARGLWETAARANLEREISELA